MADRNEVQDVVDAQFGNVWRERMTAELFPIADEVFFGQKYTLDQNSTNTWRDEKIYSGSSNSLDWAQYKGTETSTPGLHSFTEKQEDVSPIRIERGFEITRDAAEFTTEWARKLQERIDAFTDDMGYVLHTYTYQQLAENPAKYAESANDQYTSGSSDSGVSTSDTLTQANLVTTAENLRDRQVPEINATMFGSDRVGSSAVGKGYALICAPDVVKSVDGFTNFIRPEDYANEGVGNIFGVDTLVTQEVGAVKPARTRVLRDDYALFNAGGGSGNADVYYSLHCGSNFGKMVTFEGSSDGFSDDGVPMPRTVQKAPGDQSLTDPLNKIDSIFSMELQLVATIKNNKPLTVWHSAGDSGNSGTTATIDTGNTGWATDISPPSA